MSPWNFRSVAWGAALTILSLPTLLHAQPSLLQRMYRGHAQIRHAGLEERRFGHAKVMEAVDDLPSPAFRTGEAGRSVQGRSIRSVRWGNGPVQVLIWTQMHGDEPTATMAVLDLWKALQDPKFLPESKAWGSRMTLHFLPMLNPDGAEAYTRRNALGIDLNRDALRKVSPESRILDHWRDSLKADWGFNLHDQHRYYSTGESNLTAAVAFLAPPPDLARSTPPHRQDAMQLIAQLARGLKSIVPGQVCRYSDAFEARAFGDNFTARGTRTVLIEAGWITGDDEKQELRRIYFASLVAALDGIATGSYEQVPMAEYNKLPYNQNRLLELLVREASVAAPNGPYTLDIAFKKEELPLPGGTGWYARARIEDIGDLSPFAAHQTLDARGLSVVPAKAYGHVLDGMETLRETPVTTLVEQGVAIFRMAGAGMEEKHLPIPLAIRHPDDNASEPLLPGNNPVFYLAQRDGSLRWLVVNGYAWDLREEGWKTAVLKFLAKGLE